VSVNRTAVGLLYFGIFSIQDAIISKLAINYRTIYKSRKIDERKLFMETCEY